MKEGQVTLASGASRRRLVLWLLLLSLLVVALGSGPNGWRAAFEHNAGYLALNRALATSDPDGGPVSARGVAVLESAAERRPDNSATWRALGYLYLLGGDEPAAVAAWQQAGAMLPELLHQAQAAEQAGRDAEARAWYRRLPLVAANEPAAWLELGMYYERAGDWAAAMATHQSGIQNAAANSDLLYHLALGAERTTPPDWPAILQYTDRALATDVFIHDWSRLRSHRLRGQALATLGRLAEARDEFAWVVERQPDDYWATLNLAQLLWQVDGDSLEAERLFRAALLLEPDTKWAYLYLAQLYADLGRPAEARPLFERVNQLDPSDTAASMWLAQN